MCETGRPGRRWAAHAGKQPGRGRAEARTPGRHRRGHGREPCGQGNQAALSRGSYASCHRPEGELSVCGTRGRSYYSLLQLQRTSSDNAHSKCAAVPVKLLMDMEIWIHITSVQREILF